jgi:hypothetical protein
MPVSQTAYDERLEVAIIFKAVRFLKFPEAPFGYSGAVTEWGQASVRPDYEIRELLYGMMGQPIGSLEGRVTSSDVARVGLGVDPNDLPAATLTDIDRAIGAAVSWIEDYLHEGFGIA